MLRIPLGSCNRVTDVREKSREHDKEESYNAYDRRKDKHIEPQDATVTTEERKISHSPSTSESEASDSSDSEMDESMKPEETVSLSEKEINEISAKILRAELMGDEVFLSAKSFIFQIVRHKLRSGVGKALRCGFPLYKFGMLESHTA